jgi:copper chaperone CopZ
MTGENYMNSKTIAFKVEGMSCGHCEMAINKALMTVEGVVFAKADHKAGKVLVELNKEIEDALLEAAVTKAGYKVSGRV